MKLKGYSNYEIYPETGQVWSYTTNRFLKCSKQKGGYINVILCDDEKNKVRFSLHRLIWTVVNGEIPKGLQINHIDENKYNNSISNLSLVTPSENVNWGTGNERRRKAETNHPLKSKPVIASQNNIITMYYPSAKEAERNGYNNAHINNCCRGKRKSAYGYQWQYMDEYLADWWDKEMDKSA